MKIGFFGDSYVNSEMSGPYPREHWPWPRRLILDNNWKLINSGVGGSSQFDAISKWNSIIHTDQKDMDVAIWSFTWENRLYHISDENREIFHSNAGKRDNNFNDQQIKLLEQRFNSPLGSELDIMNLAVQLYYKYIYTNEWGSYVYELMLEKILQLPNLYPNIKFIFIPNTEFARSLSKKYFTKGILLDFAFETLSNIEPGAPGIMPCCDHRPNHINDHNNEIFKEYIKDLILNYSGNRDKILPIDYTKFDVIL